MRLPNHPVYIINLYGAHNALARLGFSSDDVYVQLKSIYRVGMNVPCALLRTQDKEFCYSTMECSHLNHVAFAREWADFLAAVGAAPDAEIEECWRASQLGESVGHFALLVSALARRGFDIPALSDVPRESWAVVAEQLSGARVSPVVGQA